jgi:hypothetical protein
MSPRPLAAIKAKEDHGAPFQKLCRTLRAIQLDNVILTSRLGKKPGNLGKKVKNVIDSDLYSSRLTAINHGYAEVTGNMGKFWFTPVLFVMPDSGSV